MNDIKKIYKDIEKFNMDWCRQRKIMHIHPKFVEQYYHMYDLNLVGSGSDARENLELYSLLMQRLDISNLRLQYVKIRNCKGIQSLYMCIYSQKGDLYIHYRTNGTEKKIWLSQWINYNSVLHKEAVVVDVDWV